jgi:prepilin signal peptidase PulO-like enzyme (type II secretory pathway)
MPTVLMKGKASKILQYAGIPIILTAMLILHTGDTTAFMLLLYGMIIIFGYIAFIFDLNTKRIPNNLILGMLAAWVLVMTPKLFLDTDSAITLLTDAVFGSVVGGGIFLLVYFISRKGLGGGDVKFMAAAGLYLGLYGTIPAMLYGTILAALTGLTLIAVKKITRKTQMPLAPFLYAGILITLFL